MSTTAAAALLAGALLMLIMNLSCALASSSSNIPQAAPSSGPTVIQSQASASFASSGVSKGRYKTMYACEDRQLVMDCESGFKINLIRANYGRFSIQQCNEQGLLDLSTDCMSPITLRIMTDRCQDKQKCSVNATSSLFGDKCPKTRKYLEVHFQCQQDNVERVDVRTTPASGAAYNQPIIPQIIDGSSGLSSPIQPPNQPKQHHSNNNNNHLLQPPPPPQAPQLPPQQPQSNFNQAVYTVINSEMLGPSQAELKPILTAQGSAEQRLLFTFRHKNPENMQNPRCVHWDNSSSSWSDKGSLVYSTNSTHTTCAYNTYATSYMLVMDFVGSMNNPMLIQQQQDSTMPVQAAPSSSSPPQAQPQPREQPMPVASPPVVQLPPTNAGSPYPDPLETTLGFIDPTFNQPPPPPPMIRAPSSLDQPQAGSPPSMMRVFSLFGYMLAIVFAAIALTTIAFVGSTMRSSAGAALKSLGNFSAFQGGSKYKGRRSDGGTGGTMHHNSINNNNKDLLVINNQNGHQFLYAPAQATKINSSASTHILTGTMPQNSLHQLQQHQHQQQLYSGTNGTLSNLSGTGAQSNNYYYGLMGFNSAFQIQQQQQSQLQHHLSQHHLNHQQQQQQQLQQQQLANSSSYHHQANKSTVSNESANSSPSSSGVESGSASVQQQQQQQQQQSCLMMNNDYNLMSQLANYGSSNNNQAVMSQQHQPTLTLNAHYSSSGAAPLLQAANQQQRLNQQQQLVNNSQLREHIYECVDDDKPYGARMLMPTSNNLDDQIFNSNSLSQAMQHQQQQQQRSMTLSSRLIQNAYQQQQQQQQLQPIGQQQAMNQNNKRLFSHPAIIRDNQAKTNIICSKLAQVTPQRAQEINNKFQHDVMAIFNSNCDTTTTTTTTAGTSSSSGASCYGLARADEQQQQVIGQQQQPAAGSNKLSTDC